METTGKHLARGRNSLFLRILAKRNDALRSLDSVAQLVEQEIHIL